MSQPAPDPQRQEKARKYAREMRGFFFAEMAVSGLLLLALLVGGLSIRLRVFLDLPQPLQVASYLGMVMAGYGIVLAPLSYYRGFVWPRRYGLSRQRLGGWLGDRLKGGILSLAFGLGVGTVIYRLLGSFPAIWWLLTAVLVTMLTVFLTLVTPVLILPLFFKLEPLKDPEIGQRLVRLAERARTRVSGVFTINLSSKSTTANAALMGLGNTRRIVLGDTLLQGYSPQEIEVVLAHELGHHRHGHILRLMGLEAAASLLAFYLADLALRASLEPFGFRGMADVAAFPVVALALGGFSFLSAPLANAHSRRLEAAADDYSLRLTEDPEAFIQLMTRLADQNLAEAQPSRWVELLFHDHPPYLKRVAQARRYQACPVGGNQG